MNNDPEIKSMTEVANALDKLDEDARVRVLQWAVSKYAVSLKVDKSDNRIINENSESVTERNQFEHFHELYDATNPDSGLERVLVAAYWFQEIEGIENLEAYRINTLLKNIGYPSSNITRDMNTLMSRNPRLIMQIRKEGTLKQSRKRYRLTRPGIQAVEKMIESL